MPNFKSIKQSLSPYDNISKNRSYLKTDVENRKQERKLHITEQRSRLQIAGTSVHIGSITNESIHSIITSV